MNKVFTPRTTGWIVFIVLLAVCLLPADGMAEVSFEFVNQDGDMESKFGPIVKRVVTTVVSIGLGACLIGIATGALQFFGQFLQMDKDRGKDKVKIGLIGVVFFGCFWAIMSTTFTWVGI